MITFLTIHFVINIIVCIGIYNEGEIIPQNENTRYKILHYLTMLLFGYFIILSVFLVYINQPLWIRTKWYRRQRKIRKAAINREKREKPTDIGIMIF
jgi:hypothetical protein